MLTVDYLIQGHIIRRNPDRSLAFLFPGYRNVIPLPAPAFRLYNCRRLTIALEEVEAPRRSFAGRTTRSMSRAAREAEIAGTSGIGGSARYPRSFVPPPSDDEEEDEPAGAGMEQPTPDYGQPQHNYGPNFEYLSHQLGNLSLQTGQLSDTVNTHVSDTHQWQQQLDNQFVDLNNTLNQHHADIMGYFQTQGYYPGWHHQQ